MTLGSGESRGAAHTPLFFGQSDARTLPRKMFYLGNSPLTSSSDTVYIALRLALLGNKIGHRWSRFANGFWLFLTFFDPCVRLSQLDLRKRVFYKNEQYCKYVSHATLQYNHIAQGVAAIDWYFYKKKPHFADFPTRWVGNWKPRVHDMTIGGSSGLL